MKPQEQEYINYLDTKIDKLYEAHGVYQQNAKDTSDKEMSKAYSGIASGLWDQRISLIQYRTEFIRVFEIKIEGIC